MFHLCFSVFDIVYVSKPSGGLSTGIKTDPRGGAIPSLIRCPLDAEVRAVPGLSDLHSSGEVRAGF